MLGVTWVVEREGTYVTKWEDVLAFGGVKFSSLVKKVSKVL